MLGIVPLKTIESLINKLNQRTPEFIGILGGRIVGLDLEERKITFEFTVPLAYCHSNDVVQGGFVTAMVDAAMSHSLFGTDNTVIGVATLEISTRFLGVTRGEQKLTVSGWVRRVTYRTAFLESEIQSNTGELLVTAQSIAKITRNQKNK